MEFKRLSDVEVVAEPAEFTNVLIEENGVIKKAPKTAVGGASNTSVGELAVVSDKDNNLSYPDNFYDKVKTMFEQKSFYTIVCYFIDVNDCVLRRPMTQLYKTEDDSFIVNVDGGYGINICQDGNVSISDYG